MFKYQTLLRALIPALWLGLVAPQAALAVGATYTVGSLGSKFYYRTNTVTQATAGICSSKTVPQGAYDPVSQKTFIVYPAGFAGPSNVSGVQYTAANPTIMAYNHVSLTWEGPVEIHNARALPGATSDCHNYPQVIVDNSGYLHVIHSFHNSGINLQHFKSNQPRSIISGWTRQEITNTKRNTYVAAFKDNQGEIYVLYRASLHAPLPPPDTNMLTWFEPEMYVKLPAGSNTWSTPRLIINPGRSTASNASPEAVAATSLINDSGWGSIYVHDIVQDKQRNRLAIGFSAHSRYYSLSAHRYFIYLDMTNDLVLNVNGTSLGDHVDRTEYTLGSCCTVSINTMYANLAGAFDRTYSQAIAIENPSAGYPTVYYVAFESSNPSVGPENPEYYRHGWDRLRKAVWNGTSWVDSYVSGVTNPSSDPFVGWDDISGTRVGVQGIMDAEYRSDLGTTLLYVKTKWGGTRFWLDSMGQTKPEYAGWPSSLYYQYPLRIFSSAVGWHTSLKVFNDHPDWEVRGQSNFRLIQDPHPKLRAFLKVPKYSGQAYKGGLNFANTYAIGADYVLGE